MFNRNTLFVDQHNRRKPIHTGILRIIINHIIGCDGIQTCNTVRLRLLCIFFNVTPIVGKIITMHTTRFRVSKKGWHFGLHELIQLLHVVPFVKIVNVAGGEVIIIPSSTVPLFVLMFSLGLGSPFTLFIVMVQRCRHLRGTGGSTGFGNVYVYVVYNLI